MLQGIRASPVAVPSFGHHLSLGGVQKMDGYGEADNWSWSAPNPHPPAHTYSFDASSLYASFAPPTTVGVPPRHHSLAATGQSHTSTPPPPRPQIAGGIVKAQPAFKPTWHGFLDTTTDAMTIVEAALQGRLSHISRRPHDKERVEMLTSGTVIVYEENASGIKRWTDAVHWSPSRVMNNCLIYRQLIRALKPEEKKSALNPSCGGKRKRKETASPSITNTGETIVNADDEFENSNFEGPGDATPSTESLGKVYANFAQSLSPEQQRRFCGSLIDSYEFKEGGLMKKTISVKYQGTHHHVISYYSLEDVVSGKLKRPFQDPKIADIHPRADLLNGWKVSLEDEESKDIPLVAGYSQHVQPSRLHHQAIGAITQGIPTHGMVQSHAPLLQIPNDYWNPPAQHYTPTSQTPQHYTPTASAPQHFTPTSQTPQHYTPTQHAPSQYTMAQPPPQYHSPPPAPHYQSQPASMQPYTNQTNAVQPYSDDQSLPPARHYSQPNSASQYSATTPGSAAYGVPQSHLFDVSIPVPQNQTSIHPTRDSPVLQHDPSRRSSAPVTMQHYGQPQAPQYQAIPPAHSYYLGDHKYPEEPGYPF
ncbi:hypothetical protein EJ04DRAFT_41572 [Polyplosphaeria fusca]|uniref:Camp independent regulatory protein n=1 Tax=Polyplosphaeria fusca TaxID=682080 RepID=A0A9P4V7N8_9PLEO|nr:hypothetical protein EJ04DRAFT_41572 [Polyplosphaeria fusca]